MAQRQPGDVIEFDLPNGRHAYGRVFRDASVGIYRTTTDAPSQPPLGEREYRFIVGMYDAVVKRARLVGRDPFRTPDEEWPPPTSIRDPISGSYSIYTRGEIVPATAASAAGLEPTAVWDLPDIIARIMVEDRPEFACPVCGAQQFEAPWTEAGGGSLEICPSCGIQFGYHDAHPEYRDDIHRAWRTLWLANGRKQVRPVPTFDQLMSLRDDGGGVPT
jgi:hypothetical protein